MRAFYRTITIAKHCRELDSVDPGTGERLPPRACMNCEAVGTYDVYQVVGSGGRKGPICYPCVGFIQNYADRLPLRA